MGKPTVRAHAIRIYILFNLNKKTFHYLVTWASHQKQDPNKHWLDVTGPGEIAHSYSPSKKLKPGNVKRPGYEAIDDLRYKIDRTYPSAVVCPWEDATSALYPTDEQIRDHWHELVETLTYDLSSVLTLNE